MARNNAEPADFILVGDFVVAPSVKSGSNMFNSFDSRFYILVIGIGKPYASAGLESIVRDTGLPLPNPDAICGVFKKAFDAFFQSRT
jgi:hypothetical protein